MAALICLQCGKAVDAEWDHLGGSRKKYCGQACKRLARRLREGLGHPIRKNRTVAARVRPSATELAARESDANLWAEYAVTPNNVVLGDPPPWRSALKNAVAASNEKRD